MGFVREYLPSWVATCRRGRVPEQTQSLPRQKPVNQPPDMQVVRHFPGLQPVAKTTIAIASADMKITLESELAIRRQSWVAVISAKNHKRQRRKRQSVTAKREKSQTPQVLTAILTLPNLN